MNSLSGFRLDGTEEVASDYSEGPVAVERGRFGERELLFLPRHGKGHTLAPHWINYRANIQALQRIGATGIIAVNAVGGIDSRMGPGKLAVPEQIIDYTWGRPHTFADEPGSVMHIEFAHPYDEGLRRLLVAGAAEAGVEVWSGGTYACTQGPRLETAAEVRRLRHDGSDMVGMTGMPEAALARELDLPYAALALSVNRAAGLDEEPISMEAIEATLETGMQAVHRILGAVVPRY